MKKSHYESLPGELDTPWDRAYKIPLFRPDTDSGKMVELEKGASYFIKKIEKLGGKTFYCCEGHPCGFYIMFSISLEWAAKISECSEIFAKIELCCNKHHPMPGKWVIRMNDNTFYVNGEKRYDIFTRNACLRTMSVEWEKNL